MLVSGTLACFYPRPQYFELHRREVKIRVSGYSAHLLHRSAEYIFKIHLRKFVSGWSQKTAVADAAASSCVAWASYLQRVLQSYPFEVSACAASRKGC